MSSTAKLAAQAVASFEAWASERRRAGDWQAYIRAGIINRTEVAKECGFPRSSWASNPGLKEGIRLLEAALVNDGILPSSDRDQVDLPKEAIAEIGASEERTRRAMASNATLKKRIEALEDQNAVLRAANRDLTERLRRCVFAEQHLAETGRLLPA